MTRRLSALLDVHTWYIRHRGTAATNGNHQKVRTRLFSVAWTTVSRQPLVPAVDVDDLTRNAALEGVSSFYPASEPPSGDEFHGDAGFHGFSAGAGTAVRLRGQDGVSGRTPTPIATTESGATLVEYVPTATPTPPPTSDPTDDPGNDILFLALVRANALKLEELRTRR
jgi:hypothetical protein